MVRGLPSECVEDVLPSVSITERKIILNPMIEYILRNELYNELRNKLL
jgi:hypothetical protein